MTISCTLLLLVWVSQTLGQSAVELIDTSYYGDGGVGSGGEIPGIAGIDYPIFSEPPPTLFSCSAQPIPGYYADVEALCQVFWICQEDGRADAFLCPNGTQFNQPLLTCDWWPNVDCASAPLHYGVNAAVALGLDVWSPPAGVAPGTPAAATAAAYDYYGRLARLTLSRLAARPGDPVAAAAAARAAAYYRQAATAAAAAAYRQAQAQRTGAGATPGRRAEFRSPAGQSANRFRGPPERLSEYLPPNK